MAANSSNWTCPVGPPVTWTPLLPAALDANMTNITVHLESVFNQSCNCTQWKADTIDATSIAAIRIFTSILSVLGSASIILSVLLTGKLNTAEVHPLFILSVGDFILSILWMIGGIVWLSPGEGGWAGPGSDPHTGMCYVLAIATTMAEMVTFMLTAVYAMSAFLRIREVYLNKGKTLNEKDKRKKYRYILTVTVYVLSWLLPLLFVLPITESLIGIDVTNHGCWCILDFFNLRPDDGSSSLNSPFNMFALTQASFVGVFFLLASGLIVVFYILTFVYVRKVINLQRQQMVEEVRGPKMIKTILVRLSCFVVIFLIYGIPSIAGSLSVWAERERLHLSEIPDRIILYIHAFLAPLQGILNAVVYGWSRREFRKAVNVPNKLHFRKPGTASSATRYESLNNARANTPSSRVNSLRLDAGAHVS